MLSSVFLFFSFSGSEIMLILFVALILFGGDKFPEIARGLGKGIREFKDMSDGVKREIHSQINNYDVINTPRDNSSTNTTPSSAPEPPTEPVHVADTYISAPPEEPKPAHDAVTPPVQDTTQSTTEPVSHAKPDLTQPPNTISHQSY
jgi:sec-independent protein translocase protein TatA